MKSCHDRTYTRPPHAPTALTCAHVPHMQSWAFTCIHDLTSEHGPNISHVIHVHVNMPGHISANTHENVLLLMMIVYLSINSIATSPIFLSFQLCVPWLYFIACLQYNLYCR